MADKKRVLILCTGNSARSQIAEGILRHVAPYKFEVQSAGIYSSAVRPEAIAAMNEIGIDISKHLSKSIAELFGQDFDYIITVCDNANESCPVFPGKAKRIHHGFKDPPPPSVGDYNTRVAIFRQLRDQIRDWLEQFVAADEGPLPNQTASPE